jgi:hypothetical protein
MLHVRANLASAQSEEEAGPVPELHARIDRQRQIIEELAIEGHDITSAQIILDSLLVSLFLHVQERHRLRATLNRHQHSLARSA